MIPQEKIGAATRGLSEAFGVAAFGDRGRRSEIGRSGSDETITGVIRKKTR